MAFVTVCPVDPGPGGSCPDPMLWLDLSGLVTPDQLGIDPEAIGYAFGWGFGAVVLVWFFGYVIGVALAAIRKG